ncbi:MAG: type VI secretion system-associated protein TagF [Candidatus Thiodiazotropha sp.]
MALADPPGFFGKVPEVGAFVSRRLPQDFIQPWDQWLQSAISCSRDRLGQQWLEVYLTSPIWRFALSPSLAGPDGWAGVLMPSVDRVGRYFPFTVTSKLPESISLFELPRGDQRWFESAEALALSALDDDAPTIDALDKAALALGLPCAGNSATPASVVRRGVGWWLPASSGAGYADTLDRFVPKLAEQQFSASSIWWSMGSNSVEAGVALCKGLPDVQGFTAMLAGSWQSCGWEDLSLGLPGEVENEP